MHPSEPFPHFVDDYLAYLCEARPSQASLDGIHLHDDLLEDLSRAALDAHLHALSGFGRRLAQMNPAELSKTEAVEHRIVAANIDARMHDIEGVRSWERSPQGYADLVGASLAGQALFAYAPEPERARRVVSKLRQVPRMVQAARDNIKDPAGIFVKVGLETWRGVLRFIERDLPRAFTSLDDLHILGDLADTATEATAAIGSYVEHLETEVAPRARATFRLGRERFERRLQLEEGITLSADRLMAIALRELHEVQEEFVTREGRVALPAGEPLVVAPSPEFFRWAYASLWASGPFESKPSRAYYYLTDADPSWPPERTREHMRDFNLPTLWSVCIHEVYPGHFVCARHLRQVESKVRKSTFFAPASFVEGWAHYCEQMMMEAGFRRGDTSVRLGQLSEALVRLARFVVAIRLHCEDLSVEQGMRFFRDEAFLEESTARREAERGTFDPLYLVYSAGKLMMLKLRSDYRQQLGSRYSLRGFHDAVLAQGSAPFWAHRRLLLDETTDASLE